MRIHGRTRKCGKAEAVMTIIRWYVHIKGNTAWAACLLVGLAMPRLILRCLLHTTLPLNKRKL